VLIALGSNLGDRQAHLQRACDAIDALPDTAVRQRSSLYETAAWGTSEPQPDYLNAVIAVATMMSPLALWHHSSAIEHAHGRTRAGEKNAARTLDIDLLLFDDIVIHTTELVLPHARMHQRKFVLQPLLEIAPDAQITNLGSAADWLAKIAGDDARKVSHNSSWN
jgi:2-amino-4-hydroxy-6-hydroxymethyldihydropteridine diphosphokinase